MMEWRCDRNSPSFYGTRSLNSRSSEISSHFPYLGTVNGSKFQWYCIKRALLRFVIYILGSRILDKVILIEKHRYIIALWNMNLYLQSKEADGLQNAIFGLQFSAVLMENLAQWGSTKHEKRDSPTSSGGTGKVPLASLLRRRAPLPAATAPCS